MRLDKSRSSGSVSSRRDPCYRFVADNEYQTRTFNIPSNSACGIPVTAAAYSLNVTVVTKSSGQGTEWRGTCAGLLSAAPVTDLGEVRNTARLADTKSPQKRFFFFHV